MLMMLAGVPGKMKQLLDRLTAARADNLDRIDATVSSRAPANTALLRAVWSDARAAALDLITAARMARIDAMPIKYDPTGAKTIQWINTQAERGTTGSQTLVTVTGPGVLETVSVTARGYGSTGSASGTATIVIDGVTLPAVSVSGSGTAGKKIDVVGPAAGTGPVPFYASCAVSVNVTAANGGALRANVIARRTA